MTARMETIGARVGLARRTIGISVEDFSARTGIPQSTLKKYESGDRTPGGDAIQSITKVGVDAHWLVTGEGEILRQGCMGAHPEEFATIPLYNVEACAGDGSYIEREEIATQLSFRRDWIHKEIHANPAHLHLIYVRGDSMEPDLHDGEIVMVDTSFANRVPRDGIYVVQIDHQVAVKRLQRLPGDQVKVMSSNRAYEPFTAHLSDGELKVIGKVIWHAGPMG